MPRIIFDPAKDASNIVKHGVSLAEAGRLEWDTALTWPDARKDYGEHRLSALVLMRDRLFFVAFVDRAEGRRIISLRKANKREVLKYAAND
ncbi:MAG TPA: BrnT family toxin [Alphaproteobacteria bacterium]|nr:BrnT family toxin [Alphaproteobacteria bacterium]